MSTYILPAFQCVNGRKIERTNSWSASVEESSSGQKQADTWWAAGRWSFRLPAVVRSSVTISDAGKPWHGMSEVDALLWFWTYHRGTVDTFNYVDALAGSKRVRFAVEGFNFANLAPGTYGVTIELEEDL